MSTYPALQDKLMTLSQAVSRFVGDGAQVALGGFTINRNPMALAYEIARQKKRDLHLVCHSNGQALDLLVGAGCVARIEIAYGGNGRFAPTCVRFRKAVERGEVVVEDYSNYQMALRFLAGALSVPFVPTKSGLHTDLVRRSGFSEQYRAAHGLPPKKLAVIADPFGDGGDVVLLPALRPDVALMHAQYVGDDGTVRIKGLTFADLEQAKAAKAVVVTCEEIVPAAELRADADQNALPPFFIDAVVPAEARRVILRLAASSTITTRSTSTCTSRSPRTTAYRAWLQEWVFGVDDHDEYLAKVGGKQLARLAADPVRGYAIGLDRR